MNANTAPITVAPAPAMNPQELALNYPFGDTLPATGQSFTVMPGVKWLRMPLPFALNHINLWLLEDEFHGREGWAIVDCGVATDAIRAAWGQILTHELDGKPITRVIVTHMHPDHVGNAKWLCDQLAVPLFMSLTDYALSRTMLAQPTGSGGVQAAAHFEVHGLAKGADLDKIMQRGNYYASMVDGLPDQMHRLMHGQTLRIGANDWRLDAGFGHTPEHISLHCAAHNVVISGDMLLPRISTNISVWDMEPEANPLPLFLDSLAVFEAMPADVLVLPSHGKPFRGAHTRVAQLREHHADRLAELLLACEAAPCTAADAVKVLFKRELDLHQITFALGEGLAHLHALWYAGQVQRSRNAAGAWVFATQAFNIAAFKARLASEGYQETVTVTRDATYALGEHSHPFDACALITQGAITLTVADVVARYAVGDVFELARDTTHIEAAGRNGVTYVAGRRL